MTCFLISGLTMRQFEIALGRFLKLKYFTRVNYKKDSMIQACNSIKKRLHHSFFPAINVKYFRTPFRKVPATGGF